MRAFPNCRPSLYHTNTQLSSLLLDENQDIMNVLLLFLLRQRRSIPYCCYSLTNASPFFSFHIALWEMQRFSLILLHCVGRYSVPSQKLFFFMKCIHARKATNVSVEVLVSPNEMLLITMCVTFSLCFM